MMQGSSQTVNLWVRIVIMDSGSGKKVGYRRDNTEYALGPMTRNPDVGSQIRRLNHIHNHSEITFDPKMRSQEVELGVCVAYRLPIT